MPLGQGDAGYAHGYAGKELGASSHCLKYHVQVRRYVHKSPGELAWACGVAAMREAVEATLRGRDERLVARWDIEGTLQALDLYGIFDVDDLAANLETAFGALQVQLGSSAPPSFLALLKARLHEPSSSPPTPSPAPPSTPSTKVVSCWHATSARPSTTTRTRAWANSSSLMSLQPPRASLGPAQAASRRGWCRSSGPCSSPPASRWQAQRSGRGAGSDCSLWPVASASTSLGSAQWVCTHLDSRESVWQQNRVILCHFMSLCFFGRIG